MVVMEKEDKKSKKSKIWILILAIVSLILLSWLLALVTIFLGYRNRDYRNGKIGFYIGIVSLSLSIIAMIFIKVFLPIISGVSIPLLIQESCSMHHYEEGFDEILIKSSVYSENSITLETTNNWPFKNGLDRGDFLYITKPSNLEIGDVILFKGGSEHHLIGHRLISVGETYSTKGDNYKTNNEQITLEKDIPEENIIGKVKYRIPYIGKLRLIPWGQGPGKEFC
jgi:hypothetical protein|tara:strand:- start:66 stop:740 length:675 start_codon:yes stop_codon:yes gene_type:complete